MIRDDIRQRASVSFVRVAVAVLPLVIAPACGGEPTDVPEVDGPLGTVEQATQCKLIERSMATPNAVADAAIASDPLDPAKAHTNFAAAPRVKVGRTMSVERGLLARFDLSGIPAGSVVTMAQFEVRLVSASGGFSAEVHAVTTPWDEDTVTWSDLASAPGGGVDPIVAATLTTKGTPANWMLGVDLTPLVQSWVDGSMPNDGIAIMQADGGRSTFGTSDSTTQGPRPKLVVCYAPPM